MAELRTVVCPGLVAILIVIALVTGVVEPAQACNADPFLGSICVFAFNFCPQGWVAPEGQLLPISQNAALFQLIGTTYGGDGQNTFALPDYRGRLMRGTGQGSGLSEVKLGEQTGVDAETLTVDQMPAHTHTLLGTNQLGDKPGPNGKLLAGINPGDGSLKNYNATDVAAPPVSLAPGSIGITGMAVPLDMLPPYVAITLCIALFGTVPSP